MCWLMSLTMESFTQNYNIQALEVDNTISDGHAMRFLLHVVGHVSHYVLFYTKLPYLFIHSSQLEFWNLGFFIPCRSLHRKV